NWEETGVPGFVQAALDTDGRGTIAGWLVGRTLSFRNAGAFCAIVNGARPIGYNDNVVEVAECGACIDEISAPWTAPENSLFRISDGRSSTIVELQARLG